MTAVNPVALTRQSIVQAELDKLVKQYGDVTAERVLDSARPKNSPLHDEFTWDDSAAAEAYRLEEARRLIRLHLTISTLRAVGGSKPIQAIPNVRGRVPTVAATPIGKSLRGLLPVIGGKGEYKPRAQVMADAKERAFQVVTAQRELKAWRARWADLSPELDLIFSAQTASDERSAQSEAAGTEWSGPARTGSERQACSGEDGNGVEGFGRTGGVCTGSLGSGRHGKERRGVDRTGVVWQARQGADGTGTDWFGLGE